ncbi:MAG: YraN family protein [Clostridia bacterium]|nr:YraN family protein [Clostridia bacterium]
MSPDNRRIGTRGEAVALQYLLDNGYELLCCNYRAQRCEIDLIVLDIAENAIVFVEVKTRSDQRMYPGKEAVGTSKQQHIITAATHYAYTHECIDARMRFDVIEVDRGNGYTINHIKNAFTL